MASPMSGPWCCLCFEGLSNDYIQKAQEFISRFGFTGFVDVCFSCQFHEWAVHRFYEAVWLMYAYRNKASKDG